MPPFSIIASFAAELHAASTPAWAIAPATPAIGPTPVLSAAPAICFAIGGAPDNKETGINVVLKAGCFSMYASRI